MEVLLSQFLRINNCVYPRAINFSILQSKTNWCLHLFYDHFNVSKIFFILIHPIKITINSLTNIAVYKICKYIDMYTYSGSANSSLNPDE